MKAVDTNVVVRYLTHDDPDQAALAEHVLQENTFIPLTVLLETAWVLRSNYRLTRSEVSLALNVLLDLPTTAVQDPDLVRWAIRRAGDGAPIADMIHLVASHHHASFVTFDTGIEPAAGPDTPIPIETLR